MNDKRNSGRGDQGTRGLENIFLRLLVFLSPCFLVWFTACTVPLYKVAPLPQNTPIEAGKISSSNNLEITAAALTDDDESFARFDANLPLAGIVAVDVNLVNRSNTTLQPKFALRDATGKSFAGLEAKKELRRVMKFEGVRVYPVAGKQETLEALQAIELPKKITLAAQEQKRGVLFFYAKQDVAQLRGLTLEVRGITPSISLPLN